MDVKKLMKTAPAQLEHKDKNARAVAKGLAVQVRTYTCVYNEFFFFF